MVVFLTLCMEVAPKGPDGAKYNPGYPARTAVLVNRPEKRRLCFQRLCPKGAAAARDGVRAVPGQQIDKGGDRGFLRIEPTEPVDHLRQEILDVPPGKWTPKLCGLKLSLFGG
jgi:hypothetical protein